MLLPFKQNFPSRKRRGINQVVSSLFMLAIVIPIGVVILSQGLGEAAKFNQNISQIEIRDTQAIQEDLVFEHVYFKPTANDVTISLLNSGITETTIKKITIVKIDTQELIVNLDNQSFVLVLKDNTDLQINANLQPPGRWDDPYYSDSDYKITVTTSRGNFFDIIARPFNT